MSRSYRTEEAFHSFNTPSDFRKIFTSQAATNVNFNLSLKENRALTKEQIKNKNFVLLFKKKILRGFCKIKALKDYRSGKINSRINDKISNEANLMLLEDEAKYLKTYKKEIPVLKIQNLNEETKNNMTNKINFNINSHSGLRTFMTDTIPNIPKVCSLQDDKYLRLFRQIYGRNFEDASKYTSLEFFSLTTERKIRPQSYINKEKLEKEIMRQVECIKQFHKTEDNLETEESVRKSGNNKIKSFKMCQTKTNFHMNKAEINFITNPAINKGFLCRKIKNKEGNDPDMKCRPISPIRISNQPRSNSNEKAENKRNNSFSNLLIRKRAPLHKSVGCSADLDLHSKELSDAKLSLTVGSKIEDNFISFNKTSSFVKKGYNTVNTQTTHSNDDVRQHVGDIGKGKETKIRNRKDKFEKLKDVAFDIEPFRMRKLKDSKRRGHDRDEWGLQRRLVFEHDKLPTISRLTKREDSTNKKNDILNKSRDYSITKILYKMFPKQDVDSKIGSKV